MVSFEAMLARCFNEWFDKKKIAAMAYKLPMVRYQKQGFDIYCDSRHMPWYCAIECKSIDAEAEQKLLFSQYFHVSKGVHQIEYENGIAERSGRNTILAVELRGRRGVRKTAFLVPWRFVIRLYHGGSKGITQDEIMQCCELDYFSSGYHFTDDSEAVYLAQCCGKAIKKEQHKTEVRDWFSLEPKTRSKGDKRNELN
jgi:hypothetical protein